MTALLTSNIETDQWLYVLAPVVTYFLTVAVLFAFGRNNGETNPLRIMFRRIGDGLERSTGMPAWAAAGVLSGLVVLGMAALGVYWDVAWHYDLGRDRELMTPSHTLIVIGLAGLMYAALISVVFATLDDADVGFRKFGVRIPWSALALFAFGFGGLAAFPLDALWHEAYGIDVTLWSPTHLQMVAGGGLATIVVWLMIAEARKWSRPTVLGHVIHATTAGAALVGTSAFQGEFDFGLPQFQVAYLPVLMTIAAGFVLVLARIAIGPTGALQAVAGFLAVRGIIALLVAGALNHSVPRFPLYIVAALVVEAVAWLLGTERPVRFAVAAGLGVATLGLAAEWAWADLSGWYEISPWMLPKVALLVPLAGVAAALLGAGMGRAFSGRGVPTSALAAAGLAVLCVLAVPLPRGEGDVEGVVRLDTAAAEPGYAMVEVQLTPDDAARRATAFGVVAWQGGGLVRADLERVGPGRYLSSRSLPITGTWKTMVGLQRGNQVMALPIYLPADPDIDAVELPALPERQGRFLRNTTVLLREQHSGAAWPSVLAFSGLGLIVGGWVALFALVVRRTDPGTEPWADPPPAPTWPTPVAQPA